MLSVLSRLYTHTKNRYIYESFDFKKIDTLPPVHKTPFISMIVIHVTHVFLPSNHFLITSL